MSRVVVMLLATGAVAAAVMWSARGGSREEGVSVLKGSAELEARVASAKVARSSATTQAAGGASAGGGATTHAVDGAGPATTQMAAVKGAPGAAPAAFVLPPEFAIFQTRSPFGKGPKKPATAAAGPEASFVLKGAVDVGGRLTAFIEDLGAKRVMQVAVGEAIARGKVKTITLDSIEYEAAGAAAKKIEVGQNLMGVVVPPTPTSKPAGPAGTPGQPGQPGGPPQPGTPGQPMPAGAAPGQPVRVQVVR